MWTGRCRSRGGWGVYTPHMNDKSDDRKKKKKLVFFFSKWHAGAACKDISSVPELFLGGHNDCRWAAACAVLAPLRAFGQNHPSRPPHAHPHPSRRQTVVRLMFSDVIYVCVSCTH